MFLSNRYFPSNSCKFCQASEKKTTRFTKKAVNEQQKVHGTICVEHFQEKFRSLCDANKFPLAFYL